MKERKGDWRDLLAAHGSAIDAKKLWLGFIASITILSLVTIMAMVYGRFFPNSPVALVGQFWRRSNLLFSLLHGRGLTAIPLLLPLFNPFHGGVVHLALSALMYFLLLSILTYCGGAISRLTALQYARDDIPTLQDGLKMVRAKRRAYLFAPLTPFFGVLLFAVGNIVIGLIGCIPVVGPWIMAFLLPFCAVPAALIITFIVVLGVLTFGLMLPAISIGGKDAFEGWSSAYSYLLWGFNRFVSYTVLAAVIGALTALAAYGIVELFVYTLIKTVSIGLIGKSLLSYTMGGGLAPDVSAITGGSLGLAVASWLTILIVFVARCMVFAYAISYFFTANTIICFLLRKHVDRIDVDQVYEEKPEQEAAAPEAPEAAKGPQAGPPTAEQPEGEQGEQ